MSIDVNFSFPLDKQNDVLLFTEWHIYIYHNIAKPLLKTVTGHYRA